MKSITKITKKALCVSLLTASTLMAEPPAAPASPAPAATAPSQPAVSTAPAAISLAKMDPALRRYLLNTVATTLDVSAAYLTEAANSGKILQEPTPTDLFPLVIQILDATPTTELPTEYQSFMNGIIRIAHQINDDFAAIGKDAPDEEYEKTFEKYEPEVMTLLAQSPQVVAFGMALSESGEALLSELDIAKEQFATLGVSLMMTAKNPTLAPQLATQLSQLAEVIRSKESSDQPKQH